MTFKLPIEYNHKTKPISKNIHHDINLVDEHNLYKYVFNPSTKIGKNLLSKWNTLYSYDVKFLQESQQLYKTLTLKPIYNIDTVHEKWLHFKNQDNFLITYNFVDWNILKWLNEQSLFLQLLSINTIISPLLTILFPLVILLIPFLLLKYQKINITFQKYYELLKMLFKRHPVGQLFTLEVANLQQKAYAIASVGLFLFQIYQNVKSCITFYQNMNSIYSTIHLLRKFLQKTKALLETFINKASSYPSYQLFQARLVRENDKITTILKQLNTVHYANFGEKALHMGAGLKVFYQLYNEGDLKETIDYAIEFNSFSPTFSCVLFLLL